jgi:site-specific DNA recombinase
MDKKYINSIITNSSQKIRRDFISKNRFDEQNKRTVIYTRVSTKKQTDNTSLSTQLKICNEIAKEYGYEIIAKFGERYESAKSFYNRKEFDKVIKFVKDKKNNIAFILFYDFDRFARDIEAIQLGRLLKDKYKVRIISAKHPKPPTNEFEFIQQDQQHINNYAENVKRTDKIVSGCKDKLREGYWLTKAPIGYKKVMRGKRSICVPDGKNADLIREMYCLRGDRKLEVSEIYQIVRNQGLNVKEKYCYRILENPFYCGIITHGLLEENELIKGKHEPLVTEELWLKVNDPNNCREYRKLESEYDHLALKGFLKCDKCGKNLTGYFKKLKNKYYYKCNTKGCKLNVSNIIMDNKFNTLLSLISIPDSIKMKVKTELNNLMDDVQKEKKERYAWLLKSVEEKVEKLNKAKIRYATGEIDAEIYEIAKSQINSELEILRPQLWECEDQLSNFSENVDSGLKMLENLHEIYNSCDVHGRKRLQKAVINSPLVFDREKQDYRTSGINLFLRQSIAKSRSYKGGENKNSQLLTGNSALVVSTGIEPVSNV